MIVTIEQLDDFIEIIQSVLRNEAIADDEKIDLGVLKNGVNEVRKDLELSGDSSSLWDKIKDAVKGT